MRSLTILRRFPRSIGRRSFRREIRTLELPRLVRRRDPAPRGPPLPRGVRRLKIDHPVLSNRRSVAAVAGRVVRQGRRRRRVEAVRRGAPRGFPHVDVRLGRRIPRRRFRLLPSRGEFARRPPLLVESRIAILASSSVVPPRRGRLSRTPLAVVRGAHRHQDGRGSGARSAGDGGIFVRASSVVFSLAFRISISIEGYAIRRHSLFHSQRILSGRGIILDDVAHGRFAIFVLRRLGEEHFALASPAVGPRDDHRTTNGVSDVVLPRLVRRRRRRPAPLRRRTAAVASPPLDCELESLAVGIQGDVSHDALARVQRRRAAVDVGRRIDRRGGIERAPPKIVQDGAALGKARLVGLVGRQTEDGSPISGHGQSVQSVSVSCLARARVWYVSC
mmetsp:Transcript_26292/g.55905  ORF Transcript_26292/g.55905 Transcript_26292/m.55905 type:complete len:390 (-) Transcript_26292:11-1180(-)